MPASWLGRLPLTHAIDAIQACERRGRIVPESKSVNSLRYIAFHVHFAYDLLTMPPADGASSELSSLVASLADRQGLIGQRASPRFEGC